ADDLTRARLTQRRGGGQWGARVFRFFQPMSAEAQGGSIPVEALTEAPIYPYMIAVMDLDNDLVLGMTLSDDAEDYADALGGAFLDIARAQGLPRELLVEDARTEALLADVCGQLGVALERRDAVPILDAALEDFVEKTMWPEGEEAALYGDLLDMISESGALEQVPDAALEQMLAMVGRGEMPEALERILVEEGKRRGMV
ncbi:MAG: hypothetical protein IJ646_07115, partial [Clostridia bacterium]|nr:hypothetical protein [Clostridia bacterium]